MAPPYHLEWVRLARGSRGRGSTYSLFKKMRFYGDTLDIPLGHKDAAYVRSHFDGMEVRVTDAPRANEILVAIAIRTQGDHWLVLEAYVSVKLRAKTGSVSLNYNLPA